MTSRETVMSVKAPYSDHARGSQNQLLANEAEWLAEQLLTAAFLATKSVRAISRKEA
jgi:hypothetical protein